MYDFNGSGNFLPEVRLKALWKIAYIRELVFDYYFAKTFDWIQRQKIQVKIKLLGKNILFQLGKK